MGAVQHLCGVLHLGGMPRDGAESVGPPPLPLQPQVHVMTALARQPTCLPTRKCLGTWLVAVGLASDVLRGWVANVQGAQVEAARQPRRWIALTLAEQPSSRR